MPATQQDFSARIAELKADLISQGHRVQALMEQAFDACFARDAGLAGRVCTTDDAIDSVDVEIERHAVALLTAATAEGAALKPEQLRTVLTIVKVNNELERIADAGVAIAELVPEFERVGTVLPEQHRVISNSVVGILRDAVMALERSDPHLAKVVLASEDAVEAFKDAILRDAQVQVSTGKTSVDAAFVMHEFAKQCEITASHCTNIAEQALYLATGAIVRHLGGHWQEVPRS